MWTLLPKLLFLFILHDVHADSLRKNPELLTFNTGTNAKISRKIQDEAVVVALHMEKNVERDEAKEHVLWGIDIFHFVPQSFEVSVNYGSRKLILKLASTINSTSTEVDIDTVERVESLFIRLGDEDNTVFLVVNCAVSYSVVTPLNLIKFFRSVALNKFKILFNKGYEMRVYTEDDKMEVEMQKQCNFYNVTEDSKAQLDMRLNDLARTLTQYTPNLIAVLRNKDAKSEVAVELFVRSFLSRDIFHKTSNSYRLVHLIQSITKEFPEAFEDDLLEILTKIFWTEGKENHYVRKSEREFFNNIKIRNNLLEVLFAAKTRTFMDLLRPTKDIGNRFREVFANPNVSINAVLRHYTTLKHELLDILFAEELDPDQLASLNPDHLIHSMLVHFYFKNLNEEPETLNDIHKRIMFRTDKQDYIAIGRFVRETFMRESNFGQASVFLEPDVIIGMRVVYMLASGRVNNKQDIYWTVKNMITKKDTEMPKSLEYPEAAITNALQKCYLSAKMSRAMFMHTLENLFIYNYQDLGIFLSQYRELYIYNLYRDLIMNDIQKEESILKEELLAASTYIRDFIKSIIQVVVANVDESRELAEIAVAYVNDTLSYAKLDAREILKTNEDYVTIFKKLVGEATKPTKKEKKIYIRIVLRVVKFLDKSARSAVASRSLVRIFPALEAKVKERLVEILTNESDNEEKSKEKLDALLDQLEPEEQTIEEIEREDLAEGLKYHEVELESHSTIFELDENEDEEIIEERIRKLRDLAVLDEWHHDLVKDDPTHLLEHTKPLILRPLILRPLAERPQAERPQAERPKAERPQAERPLEERPLAEKPLAEKPMAERPLAERPLAERPQAEKPLAERPLAERPQAEKPLAEKPLAEKPLAERPLAERAMAKRSLAKPRPIRF